MSHNQTQRSYEDWFSILETAIVIKGFFVEYIGDAYYSKFAIREGGFPSEILFIADLAVMVEEAVKKIGGWEQIEMNEVWVDFVETFIAVVGVFISQVDTVKALNDSCENYLKSELEKLTHEMR